jgi:hypothetical protein
MRKSPPRFRIDSAKVLNDFADPGPRLGSDRDFISIKIDLGADVRAKGGVTGPDDVLVFNAPIRPNNPNNNVIDAAPQKLLADEGSSDDPPPVRRGPGRPRGSRNKPKQAPQETLPFDAGEGNGENSV